MFSEIRPKSCTYSCGVEIYWNTEENTYYELYSRKKHICPNLLTYNKDSTSVPPATVSKPSYYTKEPSNTNESTTKIQIKPNMDNSFEFLEGSSNRIKRYYEFLSDVIRDCNGKIHGSHSHLSNNGICLIVYYEVPKGKRDEIKKKIENFINYKWNDLYQNTLKIIVIVMVMTMTIIPIRISFCQSSDTIEIQTLLKKDDFIKSSLHFQQTNLTFSDKSKICPENNCSYEFQKTTFDERFGIANTRYLSGTIQIEDKTNSNGNLISYRYYRLSGTFNLVNIKESIHNVDKVSIYEGNLLLDTGNAMFTPSKVAYKSQIKLYDTQNRLELYGKNQ